MTRRISSRIRADISNQHRGRAKTRPWEEGSKANGTMQIMRRGNDVGKDPRRSDHADRLRPDDGRRMVPDQRSGVVRFQGGSLSIDIPVYAPSRNVPLRGPLQAREMMTVNELIRIVSSVDLKHSAIKIELRAFEDRTYEGLEAALAFSPPPRVVWVHARWFVPDRDKGNEVVVNDSAKLNTSMSRAEAVATISRLICGVYTHEFEECFVIDGKRIHDPHAPTHGF